MIKIIIIENTKYRKCSSCRETKELNLENFIRRNTENGWRGRCRICYNKNIRKNQELNNTEKARYKKYRLNAKATKPFYYLFSSCKGNAKKVNREFNITITDLENLWSKQNGICYYTNQPMSYELGYKNSVSVDRINSSKGYIIGNIALCKKQVNIMKNDATLEELFNFCESILNNKEQILNNI